MDTLGAHGYRVRHSPRIWQRRCGTAGSEWERAKDIIEHLKDPTVAALWCIRGGYGSLQVLPWLPHRLPWSNKPLIGYSDATFLHLFAHATSRTVTFHGPNAIELAEKPEEECTELFARLRGEMTFSWHFDEDAVLRHGTVSGRLIGGNLTCLVHMLGTSFLPLSLLEGAVLFIEEVGEAPYRIDRMLTHLRIAGMLDRIGALLLGRFTRCGDEPSITARVMRICGTSRYPVVRGFPAGHDGYQMLIPQGITVLLDTYRGRLVPSLLSAVMESGVPPS